MNLLKISLITLFSLNTFALNGQNLSEATSSAFVQAAVEIELNEVEAWQSELKDGEIEVSILAHSHDTDEETLLTYGCHLHGSSMECHEEGDHDLLKENEDSYNDLVVAHSTAMNKLAKTLGRNSLDLSVLKSLKVWKLEDGHDDGHEHGSDVWTKAVYEMNGSLKTTFIQCHQHEGESSFACHYKKEGEGEPDLEAGHDH